MPDIFIAKVMNKAVVEDLIRACSVVVDPYISSDYAVWVQWNSNR